MLDERAAAIENGSARHLSLDSESCFPPSMVGRRREALPKKFTRIHAVGNSLFQRGICIASQQTLGAKLRLGFARSSSQPVPAAARRGRPSEPTPLPSEFRMAMGVGRGDNQSRWQLRMWADVGPVSADRCKPRSSTRSSHSSGR